ncbi:MAG: LLM class F420-dependent oxidoreductase, partial [Sporichthyaceae bacterium]|nr:LLM class F420-dependent oxidoreductase [Sporichthyaceae bacterium]
MQLRVMTEPQQGATYDDLLAVARESERLGFDAFFRSDHFQRIGPGDPGPGSTDAWVTLAGLARDTSRIRLGTMVSSATFRLPGPLAIAVATVDAMSGGRVEFGLGTGWFKAEHRSYGIRFPPTAERFDVLEEQLAVVTGLWRTPVGDTFSFAGTSVTVTDSPALPKPVQQPHPPVLIGGKGRQRTPALAARFAAEYNVPFDTEHVTAECFDRARRACEVAGRDPSTLVLSVAQSVAVGEDEPAVRRRADAVGAPPAELRRSGLAGSVDEV